MTDLAMDDKLWLDSYYAGHGERDGRLDTGRHAFDEEAALTPIFHALTSGGWQERQRADGGPRTSRGADPIDEFRRDPLTAPIPVQAMAAAAVPEQPWRRSSSRLRGLPADATGRHRYRREAWQS